MTPRRKPEPPDDEVVGDEPTAEEATLDTEGMGPADAESENGETD